MMGRNNRCLLIAVLTAVGIALNTSISAKMASDIYAVAGVSLGMDIDHVLKIYPSAKVDVLVPSCYNYGKAVWDGAETGRVLRNRDEISELTLRFASSRNDGRLIRIDYDLRVDPAKFDFHTLHEKLTKRYGTHDRVLHRRKMEPAGRIIGYVWQTAGVASLRVVLHDDFRTPSDRYRLSFLARSASNAPQETRCRSSQCSQCITP